jgi:mRNA-decapping enzyme 1B
MNFFAAAKPNPPEVPIFQRMFSNPMSVEQIEKQQRASSPQTTVDKTGTVSSSPPSKIPETTHHHENGIRFTRINSPSNHEFGTSPLATFLNGAKLPVNKSNLPQPSNQQVQQLSQDLSGLFRKMSDTLNTSNSMASPGKPTLLLPNMLVSPSTGINNNQVNINNSGPHQLAKSLSNSNVINSSNIIPNKAGQSQILAPLPSTSSTSVLLTQQGLHQATPSIGASQNIVMNATHSIHHHRLDNNNSMNSTKPEPLTKSQLLQAMNYLIKNDPDFIKKLHEAYLKSFTEMVSL